MGIVVLVLACVFIWAVVVYNNLVRNKTHAREAFSGIDVQLKRRHDLIPNLVDAVKGYMRHEQALLEQVTKLRSQAVNIPNIKEKAGLENGISQSLRSILAVAEQYPDLKASQNFIKLQEALIGVENDLQMARRYYNGTVRDYNIVVQSFPSNIMAQITNFQTEEFFEIEIATERLNPKVRIS